MEVACGIMWLVNHVHPILRSPFFPPGGPVSDSATDRKVVSREKKRVWPLPKLHPPGDKARSSRSEEPPDWLSTLDCQKVAWDSTLIYFPFLLLLQVVIHSLQLYSLASLLF